MILDMLTKGIGKMQFAKVRSMIGLRNISDCEWGGVLKLSTLARLFKNILEELSCK